MRFVQDLWCIRLAKNRNGPERPARFSLDERHFAQIPRSTPPPYCKLLGSLQCPIFSQMVFFLVHPGTSLFFQSFLIGWSHARTRSPPTCNTCLRERNIWLTRWPLAHNVDTLSEEIDHLHPLTAGSTPFRPPPSSKSSRWCWCHRLAGSQWLWDAWFVGMLVFSHKGGSPTIGMLGWLTTIFIGVETTNK